MNQNTKTTLGKQQALKFEDYHVHSANIEWMSPCQYEKTDKNACLHAA